MANPIKLSDKEYRLVTQILAARGCFFRIPNECHEFLFQPCTKVVFNQDSHSRLSRIANVKEIIRTITGDYDFYYQIESGGPGYRVPSPRFGSSFFCESCAEEPVFFISQDFTEGCAIGFESPTLWVFGSKTVKYTEHLWLNIS